MTIVRRFTDANPTVSKIVTDTTNGYVWIAYTQNAEGICHVKKVAANSLDQVFFDLEFAADEIVDLLVDGTNGFLYILFSGHSTFIATQVDLFAPNSPINFTLPAGILEQPVSMAVTSDSRLNILLPGETSATNAIIYRFNTSSGSLSETIAVRVGDIRIVDAISIVKSATNEDLWIITYTDPVKLIRMWFASGGWKFAFTDLL